MGNVVALIRKTAAKIQNPMEASIQAFRDSQEPAHGFACDSDGMAHFRITADFFHGIHPV